MARYKESYTLYTRKTVGGKTVYYYRTYTPDGKRTCGKSTGCINKSAARQYCENLIKSGQLFDGSSQRFGTFAKGYFDENSIWYQEKVNVQSGTKKISDSYVINQRYLLKNHLMPYFENIKLQDFKPNLIKQFRIDLAAKGLSLKTINLACGCLRIIINDALNNNLILYDPFRTIKPLQYDKKNQREAFTLEEIKKIIAYAFTDEAVRLFFIVAALTGMRHSEIMAINGNTLYEKFIDVKYQFLRKQYQNVKTKFERKVPIPPPLFELIKRCPHEERFFVFNPGHYNRTLTKAMSFIPDSGERGLCIHSFRHFFNTYLLAENVSPAKVAAVIGHSSGQSSMQELYTSWKPELMPEVYTAQEKLFNQIVTKI